MTYKLGIDVGGTFTDFLLVDEKGNIKITKVASTPAMPAEAVTRGIEKLAEPDMRLEDFLSQVDLIVHGTTITTNAVITGKYARTGYVTTKGFRDLLNERRGIKRSAFTAKEAPPPPIVPRYLIQCVEERIDCEGKEFIPLKEEDVYAAAEVFKKERVEAVAVNLIFSFLNPSHEQRVKEILSQELPGVYICLSSEVLPQIRVYERGSTTVFNACVGPALRNYITDLQARLRTGGFKGTLLLMQSNGGVMSPEVAMDFAANTLLSGPASGPVAGIYYANMHNIKNIVTVDMGGTSFDSCLILNQEPEITVENEVAEYRLALPSLAIHAIGAGGGSIAWIDSGGILQVGPRSAGAAPGPASYGMGGEEPTVTDADLVLGYLNPDYFLGGEFKLYPDKARVAIKEKVADKLGLDLMSAAYGIYQLVNSNMANGVRVASVSRGADPRDCVLVVAGGAGPVHACPIADELEMKLILIPKSSSVFCASGMLITDLRHDLVNVAYMLMEEGDIDVDLINSRFKEMKGRGEALLQAEKIPPERMRFTCSCDLRYEGQFNEIETPMPLSSNEIFTMDDLPALQSAFDQRHDSLYGYSLPGSLMELVSLRVKAEGVTEKPSFKKTPFAGEDASGAIKGHREIYYGGKTFTVPIYDGNKMANGNRLSGPAIVEEPTTTIAVAPNYQLLCDGYSNYLLYHKGISLEEVISQLGR